MGKADVATRSYMADPQRFADAFNYAIYDGEEVITPDALKPLDSVSLEPGTGSGRKSERRRDGLKLWQAMGDGQVAYALLGVEDQTVIHYGMPVRCMTYDALAYHDQIKDLTRKHRAQAGATGAEWLSGICKEDRLLPVVTLVLHFGSERWDGPMGLHDMLTPMDKPLAALVPDYRINLLSPACMADESFAKFRTELGIVLGYIKYAQDKDGLERYIRSESRFRNVGAESVELINTLTDSRLKVVEGEETVDMCKAIEDMRAEARNEGIEQGIEQGAMQVLSGLVRDGVLTLKDAAARAGVAPEEFRKRAAML